MARRNTATMLGIARDGDRRATLEAVRDRLARDLDSIPGPSPLTPVLTKQLADVVRELDALREPEASALDDLAARRAARRSADTARSDQA